eukprot:CAMPEP_0172589544 /NCGR_PEP_ID=MMETSP1068-20121228/8233_1 /TAXON_ID=35684 /ORGANISM="Pseudopedinella elastica, Strain CCMP716" /LENGTH=69 /DNA_ID=CAMNT_0013385159 /DNA_START=504 /DNA_END=713 /DNA_ORIENTATION=+
MREREAEIRQIRKSASEVREVFKDLADIVNDQQQEIDAVDSMIEISQRHAKNGLQQVEKASADSGCSVT